MSQPLSLNLLKEIYTQRKDQILNEYLTFLKFPSISSEPAYKEPVLQCADWLTTYLKNIGLTTEVWQTPGHPVIFATTKIDNTKPTLLIYNHYDVQPVDPLELWQSPPFEPTIRNGQVYARGAQDNKGQCFYVLQALKILLERDCLPLNVKLCIEGEEEHGSAGLAAILKQRKEQLKADYLAIVDLGIPNLETPSITFGIRGLVAMDVDLTGSNIDLHSGSHGGVIFNPIHALVELLAKVRDSQGKITIPGFYDDVLPVKEEEKNQLSLAFDEQKYKETFGGNAEGGEKQYTPMERNWLRPTLEINGICGGYTGNGFKTVIPAQAHAKISCRLVPNQDPQKIGNLVASFLEKNAPGGTNVKVHIHQGLGKAVRTNASSKAVKAFAEAFSEVFHAPCEYIYSGASIPIAAELAETCGGEIVLLGLGLAEDAIHAPNEHFGLDRIEKGYLMMSRALQLFKLEDKK